MGSFGVSTNLELEVVPTKSKLEGEQVLASRVKKETRHQVYMKHLIKWKKKPKLEATWVAEAYFKKVGIPQDLLSTVEIVLFYRGAFSLLLSFLLGGASSRIPIDVFRV